MFGSFKYKKMLLFIGQSASEEDLKKIADLNWNMVFTTKRSKSNIINNSLDVTINEYDKICDIFNNKKRTIRSITPDVELQSTDGVLNIIKISNDGEKENPFSDAPEFSTDKYEAILYNLLVDKQNDLIILGFDEEKDKGSNLYKNLWRISQDSKKTRGKIIFWNSNVKVSAKEKLSEIANITICETSFSQALEKAGISINDYLINGNTVKDGSDDFFYCAGKRISIDKTTLPGIRSDTELLTESFIYQEIPLGKIALKDAFWEYILPDRYTFPKWFGYFPKSRFYINRTEIDEKLYQSVTKALKNGSEEPIILYGEPCSGKTCAIGLLAYRIYTEQQYPVVFIRPSDYDVLDAAKNLNELFALIDDKTQREKQILLIWDSSAETQGDITAGNNSVYRLFKKLTNDYGRRFVMVCTSYIYVDNMSPQKAKNKLTIERKIENKDIFLKEFEKVLREYNVIDNKYINFLLEKYKNKPDLEDISLLFDDLTTLFDDFFSDALKLEQSVLTDYILDQLNQKRNDVGLEPFNNPFLNITKDDLDFFSDDNEEIYDISFETETSYYSEDQKKQFEVFNLCIALFCQIDMKIAYPIAFHFFPEMNLQKIECIPWLRYNYLDENNIFYICFRNIREAQLHLKNYFKSSNEDPRSVVKNIMKEIVNYFINDLEAQSSDFIKKSVVDFFRYYGPNKVSYISNGDYNNYKLKPKHIDELKEIIKPIYDLLESYNDKDGSFSIIYATYNHEFFRDQLNNLNFVEDEYNNTDMIGSMEQLQKTIGVCKKAIEQVNESMKNNSYPYIYLSKQKNSLITEQTICDTLLKQCQMRYLSACKKQNKVPEKKWATILVSKSFDDIYKQISGIIACDPENDYFYNALFQSFEAYVEMEKMHNRIIDVGYIVKMGILIDEGNNNLPSQCTGTGSEFLLHVNKFNNLSRAPLTIDDISSSNLGSYQKYYDDIKTKAGVIMYACRNTYDIEKAFKFLLEPEVNAAMKSSYYANEFKLRITWEYFTGKKFVFTDECQCIGLKTEQWEMLYDICNDYMENTHSEQNQTFIRKPMILLVYALSMLQTGRKNYLDTIKFIKTNITEGIFFNNNVRMRTPFMVCNSEGIPVKYSGTVIDTDYKKNTGLIKISNNLICRCNCHNIDAKVIPVPSTRMNDLELGLGYTGFSVYTEKGRERKQVIKQNENK